MNPARQFRICPHHSWLCPLNILLINKDAHQYTAFLHPCSPSYRCSKRKAHALTNSVSTSSLCLFVFAKDMMGINPYLHKISFLAQNLEHVTIDCKPHTLKCIITYLDVFINNQI